MNKIIIIGHVGQAPEMRYTPAGKAVSQFSVATSHKYTKDGQPQEETTWFRVSAWDRLAEIVNQYLVKGQQVYVEGRLSLRTYTTQDGRAGASLDVTAQTIEFLGKREAQPRADEQPVAGEGDVPPY